VFKAYFERIRSAGVLLGAMMALVALAPSALAKRTLFFEETASAFWEVPYACPGGETVSGTLLVESTRDFSAPDTDDTSPTVRVQFLAVCNDGSAFTWSGIIPATIISTENLKSVVVSGSGTVTDINRATHNVTFEVTFTGAGRVTTTVNGPGSMRQQREAIASGTVTFDGQVLVSSEANHPTRPAPFIRVDTEK
jgi:hypothetical protein